MSNINVAIAFLAGFASFFSPCLFPLFPAFISLIAGEAAKERKPLDVLPSVILFVIGFSTVFSLLGVSVSLIGSFMATYKAVMAKVAGVFIIFLGLSIMNIIKIPFLMRERRPIAYKGGAFMLGLAFGFGWTPCIGTVLAGILAIAGSTGTVGQGVILLIAFCLGLGLPFIVFGTLFSYLTSTFDFLKKYNKLIYRSAGVILIITGILLLSGYFAVFSIEVMKLFS